MACHSWNHCQLVLTDQSKVVLRQLACARDAIHACRLTACPGISADRAEDAMQYGEGNQQRAREDAVRERMQKWACWLKEKPDEAADWLKHIDHNWQPADIPRE